MKAKCPKCGFEVPTHLKEWEVKALGKIPMRIYSFVCPKCGTKFRRVVKDEKDV